MASRAFLRGRCQRFGNEPSKPPPPFERPPVRTLYRFTGEGVSPGGPGGRGKGEGVEKACEAAGMRSMNVWITIDL